MTQADCDCGMDHGDTGIRAHNGRLRIFCITFPKSGTNIISQFWSIEGKPPTFIGRRQDSADLILEKLRDFRGPACSHLPYSDEIAEILAKTTKYFLFRDPRDNAISQLYHAKKWPETPLNYKYADGSTLIEQDDPLLLIIESLPKRWGEYLPWLDVNGVMPVRYEDLVIHRRETVERMVHHAGADLVRNIGIGTANDWLVRYDPIASPTFRQGITGQWKREFQEHHVEAFNAIMGETMEALGYE